MSDQPTPAPFDPALVALRRKRAVLRGPDAHFLMRLACDDLTDRLMATVRPFDSAITLFDGGAAARAIQAARPQAMIATLDLPDMAGSGANALTGTTEHLGGHPATFALAVSLLGMHAVNDLPGFLVQARRLLRPDGLFLGCMLGTGTLQELRATLLATEAALAGGASPRVAPFADIRDMGALMQRAGFALPVTDADTFVARYDSLFALIDDLRAMGMANALYARSRKPLTRAFWAAAAAYYAEHFADADGRIRATFTLNWVSGWAPDASQPKALKPGSATISLKDVL